MKRPYHKLIAAFFFWMGFLIVALLLLPRCSSSLPTCTQGTPILRISPELVGEFLTLKPAVLKEGRIYNELP